MILNAHTFAKNYNIFKLSDINYYNHLKKDYNINKTD